MEEYKNKIKSPKKNGFKITQVQLKSSPKKKLKSPKKIGRFKIRQVSPKSIKIGRFTIRKVKKKSPLTITKPLSYDRIEKLQKGLVYKKILSDNKKKDDIKKTQLSPYSETDDDEPFISHEKSSLIRQTSGPEFSVKKVDLHGFHFDIIDNAENFETKIIYLSDKIKDNLLKLIEVNKIEASLYDNKIISDDKVIIKNNIKKYTVQLNEMVNIMDELF